LIGTVVRLQVQASSLKVGAHPRRYDPAPIEVVSTLHFSSSGVVGVTENGNEVVDVHHHDHPTSKNRGGENGISLGFSSHYLAMRARFGQHLPDGVAGENILVETQRQVQADELAGGLIISGPDGRQLALHAVIVAAPCVEFARYVLNVPDDVRPDRAVTEALQFLHDGMRGYYASYGGGPAAVAVGDRVYLG